MPQCKQNTMCYQYTLSLTAISVQFYYRQLKWGRMWFKHKNFIDTQQKLVQFELLQKDSFCIALSKSQSSCASSFPRVNMTEGNLLSLCLYNTQHHGFLVTHFLHSDPVSIFLVQSSLNYLNGFKETFLLSKYITHSENSTTGALKK